MVSVSSHMRLGFVPRASQLRPTSVSRSTQVSRASAVCQRDRRPVPARRRVTSSALLDLAGAFTAWRHAAAHRASRSRPRHPKRQSGDEVQPATPVSAIERAERAQSNTSDELKHIRHIAAQRRLTTFHAVGQWTSSSEEAVNPPGPYLSQTPARPRIPAEPSLCPKPKRLIKLGSSRVLDRRAIRGAGAAGPAHPSPQPADGSACIEHGAHHTSTECPCRLVRRQDPPCAELYLPSIDDSPARSLGRLGAPPHMLKGTKDTASTKGCRTLANRACLHGRSQLETATQTLASRHTAEEQCTGGASIGRPALSPSAVAGGQSGGHAGNGHIWE